MEEKQSKTKQNEKFKRFFIKGVSESDVHGVRLRESIHKIAKGLKLKGWVKNIKGQVLIEIVYSYQKADESFRDFLEKNLPAEKLPVTLKDLIFSFPEEFQISEKDYIKEEYELIREDELTEMVWALQGAGKAFIFAQKQQEEVRKNNMLVAIESEVTFLSKMCDDIQWKNRVRLRPVSIEFFLKEPPVKEKKLIDKLRELYQACNELNEMKDDEFNNEEQKHKSITGIMKLCGEILKNDHLKRLNEGDKE